jgi:hypothetical protein
MSRRAKDPFEIVATLVRLKARAAEGRLAAERAAEQRAQDLWRTRRERALASRGSLDCPPASQAAHAAKLAFDARARAAEATDHANRIAAAAADAAHEARREIAVDAILARLKALRR